MAYAYASCPHGVPLGCLSLSFCVQAQICSVVQYNSLHLEFVLFVYHPLYDWTGLKMLRVYIKMISDMINKHVKSQKG